MTSLNRLGGVLAVAALALEIASAQSSASFVSAGKTIHVDVFQATAPKTHPSVIFLYGSDGMALIPWYYSSIGSWFASQGCNFYLVHYFDRTNTTIGDPLSNFFFFNQWLQTVDDATTWVATQPGVDPNRLAMMGISLGSFLGIAEAVQDPRIKVLADWYGGLVSTKVTHLPPTIILHGANDPIVNVSSAYQLQSLLQALNVPYAIHIYPGEGHGFDVTDQLDALQRTLAFFVQEIGR